MSFFFAYPLFAQPDSLFTTYVNAIAMGQWNKAESCWDSHELISSKRLGINYDSIPYKYDCASPLFVHLDELKSGKTNVKIDSTVYQNDYALLYIKIVSATDSTRAIYYAIRADDKWHLSSPMRVLVSDWKTAELNYVSVRYHDLGVINQYALDKANDFINSACAKLKMPDSLLNKLKSTKIDYYLGNEADVKKLTGFDTKGMANLQFDAVITKYLPHPHELVHLLINYDYQQLPLYTEPFMQEGLATYLGGRWGKSPEVIFYFGEVNLALGMANLEDMLTYNGFHGNAVSSDISYALSGLFVNYLVEKFGVDKFKQLYLELSGTNGEVVAYSAVQIKNKIEQKYQMPWTQIEKEFLDMAKQYEYCGLRPDAMPSKNQSFQTIGDNNMIIQISKNNSKYYYSIKSTGDSPRGILLFKNKRLVIENTYKSDLFAEQLPKTNYSSEMYGLQFSPDEVGFYNYLTNTLLAKYVLGFSPSDIYWNATERTINFSLDKKLIDGDWGDYDMIIVKN